MPGKFKKVRKKHMKTLKKAGALLLAVLMIVSLLAAWLVGALLTFIMYRKGSWKTKKLS